MSERDYVAEMRAVIDEETANGPYTAAGVAEVIVEKLRANDPELLDGWLHAQAVQLIREAIGDRDRSKRGTARANASRSRFADAARAAEDGDDTVLREEFLGCRYVVEDDVRKPLADLTHEDLLFVAADYERQSNETAFEAAFMRALAKKVRRGVVGDHFDEAAISRLRASIAKTAPPPVAPTIRRVKAA